MSLRLSTPLALMLLAACGGNPLNGTTTPAPTTPTTPTTPATPVGVVVPDDLKNHITQLIYSPAADPADSTIQIAIAGLDTTPLLATWSRRPSMDVPGFTAFAVQEDALDRLFVAMGGQSNDESVRAVLAHSGGQFNHTFAGTIYERSGEYTPPDATASGPATGQVRYVGSYTGMQNAGATYPNRNAGTGAGMELMDPGTADPATLPAEALRVTGRGFINANFAKNKVEGVIFDRVVVNGPDLSLGNVILVPTDIDTASGTFGGTVERPGHPNENSGSYGGVFGGVDAGGLAGAVNLTRVYTSGDTLINDLLERGVFVLNQCGLTTSEAACAGAAP